VLSDLPAAVEGADVVLSVMPSHLVRRIYGQMLPHLREQMLFVSATKGLENGSLLRTSEVIREVLSPKCFPG
jgi:glycerol-3-phosphate dehydrogenase (NAD(P)+)